jgi:hypothetical protein
LITVETLQTQLTQLETQQQQLLANSNAVQGAIQLLKRLIADEEAVDTSKDTE